jgi:hypothetical protein
MTAVLNARQQATEQVKSLHIMMEVQVQLQLRGNDRRAAVASSTSQQQSNGADAHSCRAAHK